MIKTKHIKNWMVWLLIAAISAGDLIPALAHQDEDWNIETAGELDADYNKNNSAKASASNTKKASDSNAKASNSNTKKDVFADMPKIGSDAFTEWFFENVDHEALWNWVIELMASPEHEDYAAYMEWYLANESRVTEAMQKYFGIAMMSLSTGDLWKDWAGDMDWNGLGTERAPYQIQSLAELMGLSELVASGTDFNGVYFELANDIDLGNIQINNGNWNPIGWYQNASELTGTIAHPFKGHFDGAGNTISGLRINHSSQRLSNVGLFGLIAGGSVKNLIIEAEDVYGIDNVGILAGSITGDTIIYNVTISGYVFSERDAGGIAGEIAGDSKQVTIENCTADGIVIYSSENTGFTGGIAGNVQNADLVDNTVRTYDGNGSRIAGKGYVGGIAGRMNRTNIYNSYVDGTIGGNGSLAAGGLVGKYESGNLIVGRFAGNIGSSNSGTASREGTFVGTREGRHNFTYGTGSSNNIAYLYTTDGAKAKTVFGSNIDGDNTFTRAAHIGYWGTNDPKFTIVAGRTSTPSGDMYFYEELEAGIKHIIVNKLDKDFTSSGYYEGLSFKMDHYAPGFQGEPVRGYLVSVPRIDALNANGTYDTDIATLTALPVSNNSYYRQIDKDNPAAVAFGVTVSVSTAAKNSNGSRYQMVYDGSEDGKAKPPTYVDVYGDVLPMNYMAGGTYSFTMPECDTELNVQYIKVTTELTMTPAETTIFVTQIRSGDRKNPAITTEVKNSNGILIARYIDGIRDTSVEVQPIAIHAEHNNAGNTADQTVLWSVDDTDLLVNSSTAGHTLTDARVIPNMQSTFIQSIINREVQAQTDAGYENPIADTVYTKHAVVTAATNPATSADNQIVYGNTKVTVSFRIIDNTTLRVEGLVLNKSQVTYTVTRKLTGDRLNPTETITCSVPTLLTATLNPNRPFFKHVTWADQESGKIITLTPGGDYTQNCAVDVRFDATGAANPVWIQNVINADNQKKQEDPYARISGHATYTEVVTAASEDQTNGHVSTTCDVTIHFITVDETVIYPEYVLLNKEAMTFNLVQTKTGRRSNPTITWTGTDTQQLSATVYPDLPDAEGYRPYDRRVNWTSGNAVLTVNDGSVSVNLNADWIKTVLSKYPSAGTIEVPVAVTTVDGGKTATCIVTVNVSVVDTTTSGGSGSGGSGGSGGGGGSSSGTRSVGAAAGGPASGVTGTWNQVVIDELGTIKWMFTSSNGHVYINEWAYIYNPYAGENQPSVSWFWFDENGYMSTGWYIDVNGHVYYLNPFMDNTQGIMVTGWRYIDDLWFFFNQQSTDSQPLGCLLKNTFTPDGYQVNDKGQWIPD